MNKQRLPTIIGISVLVIGLALGIYLVQVRQIFRSGATPELSPRDVRLTNITSNSTSISWTTDTATTGLVKWGENQNSLSQTQTELATEPSTVHFVNLAGLSPSTNYFFTITSGGEEFDNNGIPWEVTSGVALTPATGTLTATGSVLTATSQAASGVVVHLSAPGMSPLSAVTSADGNWIIPLSQARSSNLNSYLTFNNQSPLLSIFVQGGDRGVASAQIYPRAIAATPTIILGQTHDFRNETGDGTGGLPEAGLELPETATQESGFEIPTDATPSAEAVTLESHEEGEVVTTSEPEFFGSGPVGTTITITVESTPQTETVTIGSDGEWQFSPPEGLEDGEHKISLSWRDSAGVLRTLTRLFTVSAAEGEPAFEATPSGGTKTPSPSPKATASPSATPRVSLPATDSAVPESGSVENTFLFLGFGLGLLGLGSVIYYFSVDKWSNK